MLIYPIYKNNVCVNVDPNDTKALNDYFQTKYDILHFDVTDGILQIINNKIYKMKKNVEFEHYQFSNEISLHLKNNDVNNKNEMFHIPLGYTYDKLEIKKYKLTNNSLLTLLIENNKKIYFETSENEITESIKEDLITFLSLLKLYK
jgi:hypothetical protein